MQEEEFDQKLKEIDSKISYMKQVINGRNYPIQNKKAAGKSLSVPDYIIPAVHIDSNRNFHILRLSLSLIYSSHIY